MTKWEYINNKRFHSHLSYSNSRPIHISLSNLVLILMEGMRIPHFPFLCASLLVNAKKLCSSSDFVIAGIAYINPDFTAQERQHQFALREDLKICKASAEKRH